MSDITPIKQPSLGRVILTGFAGIVLALLVAVLVIAPFDIPTFMGWVGLVFLAATPAQIVLSLLWGHEFPVSVGKLPQPTKGLALTLITIILGVVIAAFMHFTVGGQMGPTLMLTQYMILSVVVALWVVPIWQAWPFSTMTKNPVLMGVSALIGFYVIAFVLWRIFFNYDIMSEAPFYSAAHAPSGLFPMWTAMVFAVTSGAIVVLHVLFDFWPMEKLSMGKAQPIRGIISSIYVLALTFLAHWIFLGLLKMDPVAYMVQVPVCLIFGVFLTVNMMQNQIFRGLKQPVRGLAQMVPVILGAVIMYNLYKFGSTLHAGETLPSGPENLWQQELWISTAMLGITFPLIIMISGFFDLWPFAKREADA